MNTFEIYQVFVAIVLINNCVGEYKYNKLLSRLTTGSDSSYNTANCILKLSTKYFVDKKKLRGNIVIINIDSYASTTQQIILETIYKGKKYSVMVKDSKFVHKNASHFPEKAKNYMMILEQQSELGKNIDQLNKLPTWNPHAKAIVYIQFKYDNKTVDTLVKELINELNSCKLLKSIVFVDFPHTKEIKSYSWKPYTETSCGNTCEEIQLLDICKDNNIVEISPLTDINLIQNLKYCPFYIYTVISEPYVLPPKSKMIHSLYDDVYDFEFGIEIKMLKIISEIMNLTLIIRFSNETEDLGDIFENGTFTGLFERLKNNEVDAIVGNIQIDRLRRKYFDSSCSYMQDEITWCVQKAGAALTWTNIVTIFTLSTWASTLAVIIFMSFLFHWMKFKEDPRITKWPTKSILMTVGMVLGWGAMFRPKRTSFRVLIVGWLLFCININTTYQSFLRSFLIHPKSAKQIANVDDMMNEGYTIVAKEDIYDSLKRETANTDLFNYLNQSYKECLYFRKCIELVRNSKNKAVAGSKIQVEYQDQHLGKGHTLIYCFDDSNIIHKYGAVVLYRKWYPFVLKFNRIIRSLTENGMILGWNKEVSRLKAATKEQSDESLGMAHMLGAFIFLFIGYAVCLIAYLVELLVFHITHKKSSKHVEIAFHL